MRTKLVTASLVALLLVILVVFPGCPQPRRDSGPGDPAATSQEPPPPPPPPPGSALGGT